MSASFTQNRTEVGGAFSFSQFLALGGCAIDQATFAGTINSFGHISGHVISEGFEIGISADVDLSVMEGAFTVTMGESCIGSSGSFSLDMDGALVQSESSVDRRTLHWWIVDDGSGEVTAGKVVIDRESGTVRR